MMAICNDSRSSKMAPLSLGLPIPNKTDHPRPKELMLQVVLTPKQQYYLSKLLGYDFEIIYRPGKHNQVADALSRQEEMLPQTQFLTFATI